MTGAHDEGAYYDPDGDRWVPMWGPNPAANGHTTVWTGEEMLVWSGFDQSRHGVTPEGYGYRPPPL